MAKAASDTPYIVGIGGAATPNSSTERSLALALASAEKSGARTHLFGGAALAELPHYLTPAPPSPSMAANSSPRSGPPTASSSPARAITAASRGWSRTRSIYIEETAKDRRVYLDGVPVGLIATAYGWQATGSTLATLRSIVHALRGWPTPLGAAINTTGGIFRDGVCTDDGAARQLDLVGRQVYESRS